VRCHRAEPLDGQALLFAVGLRLGGACHLQTHLQAGSLHHVLEKKMMDKNKVEDERQKGILWFGSSLRLLI